MHRVPMAALLLPLTIFPIRTLAQNAASQSTQLTVAVFNDARVPPVVLSRAEQRAASIFARANFEVVWVHCLHASAEDAVACKQTDRPGHLALRIIPDAMKSASHAVFGIAFLARDGSGKYSDVFWRRAEDLHTMSNLDIGSILGSVMGHEMGHLLLGSNAHSVSGIMRSHWEAEELRRIAMGTLLFTPQQAERMQGRMRRLVEPAEQPLPMTSNYETSINNSASALRR